jgi:hypothetical protein
VTWKDRPVLAVAPRLTSRRLLVLATIGAAALLAWIAIPAASAEEPAPCIEASFPAEGVRVLKVEVMSPSGAWVTQTEAEDGICGAVEYESPSEVQVDTVSDKPLPKPGTKIRMTVESRFYPPLYTTGLFGPGQTVYEGNRVIVTGTVKELLLPIQKGAECLLEEEEDPEPQWFFALQLDRGDPAEEAYAGSYFATNSYPALPKVLEGGKAFSLDLSGCGDADPNTADGFFDGFIPDEAAARLGISAELIAGLSAPIAGQLVQVTNNGQSTTAGLTLEKVAGGLHLDYALSYSTHHIVIRANHKAIALTRHCKRTQGKLRVERVKHKVRSARLTCKSG